MSWSELPRARPLPVLLLMPGSPNRKEDLLRPRALLPLWAQAGFLFVLTIDRPYHGERPGDPAAAIRAKGLPRVLGEYVLDLQRALDYAAARPEADAGRIGMMGLSMGGMGGAAAGLGRRAGRLRRLRGRPAVLGGGSSAPTPGGGCSGDCR